jgi:hypothetical protein
MKRTIACLGVLLVAGAMISSAQASKWTHRSPEVPDGTDYATVTPDAQNGGHWYTHPFSRGTFPGFAAFHRSPKPSKLPPGGPEAQGQLAFPTHNYARSPRDFYMLDN